MDLQSIGDKTNRSFSPVTIPASACLDDAFLYINFKEGVTNVSISITNQETGITTFIMTIKEIPLYSIPLMEMESGIYRLEMIIDGLRVYGDFDI
ncbi:MAG: DUF3244 domain-containing protein [Bacteroides sp.]|nr:DUF3244 domain-containing protein [Bacteroides sp.]